MRTGSRIGADTAAPSRLSGSGDATPWSHSGADAVLESTARSAIPIQPVTEPISAASRATATGALANTIVVPAGIIGDLRRWLAQTGAPAGEAEAAGARLRRRLADELRPQARMWLSLHIPKTAGLTFSLVLAEVFREDFFRSYWEITNCRGETVPAFPANARCIHGHIDLRALLPAHPDALLLTWVREPVQRVASLYHYWRREPDLRHPLCRALHERQLSLLDFARQEQARNDMTRFFAGYGPADFAFVGLFEELGASMDLFFRKFGLPPMPLAHGHRNPDRGVDGYPVSAGEQAEIAELNADDVRLYRECARRFAAEREARHG